MIRFLTTAAAVLGFAGVALGAFGAHGLKKHFEEHPELLPLYKTATEYQMYHALALLAVAWAGSRWSTPLLPWAGGLFLFGMLVFSGSLYLIVFTQVRTWGAITPIGGVALLAGWACVAIAACRGTDLPG